MREKVSISKIYVRLMCQGTWEIADGKTASVSSMPGGTAASNTSIFLLLANRKASWVYARL